MSAPHGWIGVDLDGTLAEHYWSKPDGTPYDELLIGKPVPAMVQRIRVLLDAGYEVRIFTARVGPHGSAPGFVENLEPIKAAIRAWTATHIGTALEPTCTKDYHMIALWDDRAVRVEMDTGEPCCDHYESGGLKRPEERAKEPARCPTCGSQFRILTCYDSFHSGPSGPLVGTPLPSTGICPGKFGDHEGRVYPCGMLVGHDEPCGPFDEIPF